MNKLRPNTSMHHNSLDNKNKNNTVYVDTKSV